MSVGRRALLIVAIALAGLGPGAVRGEASYASRGTIKAIADDHSKVSIAHEPIAGYMPAMTMSFVPRTASQLDGLEVGDRVRFSFVETDDGDRVLTEIVALPRG